MMPNPVLRCMAIVFVPATLILLVMNPPTTVGEWISALVFITLAVLFVLAVGPVLSRMRNSQPMKVEPTAEHTAPLPRN